MRPTLLISLIFCFFSIFGQKQPPQAKQVEYADTLHGVIIPDPYKWMENLKSPELLKYVKEENKYTKQAIKKTNKLKKEFYKEAGQRKVISLPPKELFEKPDGEYIYYERKEGKNVLHCRKKRDKPNNEAILLNEKELFEGKNGFEFETYKLSPNEGHIAYTIFNYYLFDKRILIKNLQNPNIPQTEILNADFEKWINDSTFLYYRPCADGIERLYIHRLGTQNTDKLIYEQLDKSFEYKSSVSNSRKFIFIEFLNADGSEVYYIDADAPYELKIVSPFEKGNHYSVYHDTNDTVFYIKTNLNAPNFKIVTTSISNPDSKNWVDFLPETENYIQWIYSADGNWLILDEYDDACIKITIVDKKRGERLPMVFDEIVYNLSFIHLDTLKKIVRFKYESFITPETYYDYNLETKQLTKLFETQISNYNRSDYAMEFINVTAHDGYNIPVTIIYNKNLPRDGTSHVVMDVRGDGFIDNTPYFVPSYLTFLNRGFYRVCPAIRGGGGSISQRVKDGSGLYTKNRAHDVASVAKYLINEKYTSAGMIHAIGRSGGGKAMGMVANMYPELFGSLTFEVARLDVMFINDENSWFHIGNQNIKEEFDYMIDYSPYQNIKKQAYPAMLFIIGLNDRNVPAYNSLKMVAKIRANNTANTPIYLSTDLKGNHYYLNNKKILLGTMFTIGLINKIIY